MMNNLSKYFLTIVLLTLTIGCSSKEKKTNSLAPKNQEVNRQEQLTLSRVEIDYEDMYTTTFTSISCKGFEKAFSELIAKKTLTGSRQISTFENFINQTLISNVKTENIDVRVKARLFYSDSSTKEICLGLHSLQYEGIKYSISEEFTQYLLQITETEDNSQD